MEKGGMQGNPRHGCQDLRYNLAATRRGARAVEWDGLENRCGSRATVGSNPTLSARGF